MVTYDGDDPVCNFSRDLVLSTAAYAMNRVGEAAPDAKSVDAALKLGFSRSVGPIESLDAIGLETARGLMQDAGIKVPALLEECIASTGRFSKDEAGQYSYWDRSEKALVRDTTKDGLINLKSLRSEGKVVRGPAPLSLALAHLDIDEKDNIVYSPWTETDFRTGLEPWWK